MDNIKQSVDRLVNDLFSYSAALYTIDACNYVDFEANYRYSLLTVTLVINDVECIYHLDFADIVDTYGSIQNYIQHLLIEDLQCTQ